MSYHLVPRVGEVYKIFGRAIICLGHCSSNRKDGYIMYDPLFSQSIFVSGWDGARTIWA